MKIISPYKDMHEKLGKNIRKLRKNKGYTMREMKEKTNMHYAYFSSLEKGERNISVDNLYKIAKALRVNITELFKGI